ncbi:MAG: sigma-70 family RNA polymerase sigma factor [Phycisphaerae bacterium]|nr:sigma-70 family RNA polymerase sigma factor [Phycisphaerae bacterium]
MRPAPTGEAVLTAYAQTLVRIKARQLSRKPGFSRSDQDDLEQELAMHLVQQARHYDPRRASPNTFAARVIQSKVRMILRDRKRLKRAAGFTAQSLDAPVDQGRGESDSLCSQLTAADLTRRTGVEPESLERAEIVSDVVETVRTLPPDLRDIWRRLIEGNISSVARDLDISRPQVRDAIERIRLHFEAHGFGDSDDSRTPDPPTA